MKTLISSEGGLLAMLAGVVAFAFLMQRVKFFRKFGPALLCVVTGIVLSNLNVVPHWADIYGVFFTYAVPMSLTMVLLNINIKEWIKVSRQPLLAMLFACVSVSVMALLLGLVFAPRIDEGWKLAGMLVGTWTGGSSNLTAIGIALDASPEILASANAGDYVIGIPMIFALFALPGIINRSKKFRKIWPHSLTDQELDMEGSAELFGKKEWSISDIALLFALAFTVTAVSTILAKQFNAAMVSTMRIIFITTISLVLAQIKPVRQIKGNIDLGIFVAMFFLVIIGLMIDVRTFLTGMPVVLVFTVLLLVSTGVLFFFLCRIGRIKIQYLLVAFTAAFADGSSAALVAAAGNWKALVGTGVILGAIGNAAGNYLGIAVGYLIKYMTGR